jgi:hypothetical protein
MIAGAWEFGPGFIIIITTTIVIIIMTLTAWGEKVGLLEEGQELESEMFHPHLLLLLLFLVQKRS